MLRKIKLQGHVKLRLCSDPFGEPTERSKQISKREKKTNEDRDKQKEGERGKERKK